MAHSLWGVGRGHKGLEGGGVLLWSPVPLTQLGDPVMGQQGHYEPVPGLHGVTAAGNAATA